MRAPGLRQVNRKTYEGFYATQKVFLRHPADWVVRFHNMYMKKNLPSGRVLDYGFGSGNNSIFLIENGYEVWGIDVAGQALNQLKTNLKSRGLPESLARRFRIISPETSPLPFKDGGFDFVISNQVLYYLASEAHIRKVCRELVRCLRPGGVAFFTMLGPKNYYITHHVKQIHHRRVYEVEIEDPSHRLHGLREMIYLVRDDNELRNLFSDFECLTTGFFDQRMFDLRNFHWIFVGRKPM